MRRPQRSRAAEAFGPSFWVFVAVFGLAAWTVWELKGAAAVREALANDLDILVFLAPRMIGGMLLAGLVQAILPPDLVARWVGEESGMRGIIIGAVVGALTPGGPMTSFPIVVAFYMSGADRGALVAYLTGWSLLGFQRTLVWELPLLGEEFTLYRIAAVIALPVLAGVIARRIPLGPVGPGREVDGAVAPADRAGRG
ncbi:MAG: permease [Alphaproteobacteria bacterium]|nr:permease [Alphaproteobacteria bacterium]